MATPDMDVIKEIPGYKVILKAILKSQIQQLVEQLAATTDEESVILTASVTDGTLCHLGSDSGKSFLEDHEDFKSQFLGFCLKKHHRKKQEKQEKERQEAVLRSMPSTPPRYAGPRQGYMHSRSPRFTSPRHQGIHPVALTRASPGSNMRPQGVRHEPYSVGRPPRRPLSFDPRANQAQAPMRLPVPLGNTANQVIKIEPDDSEESTEAESNIQISTIEGAEKDAPSSSQPSSPSQANPESSTTDIKEPSEKDEDVKSESSSSTIPNESSDLKFSDNAPPEGLSLDSDLSNLIPGDSTGSDGQQPNTPLTPTSAPQTPGSSSGMDPSVNVKVEAITESEMELEITGVELGPRPPVQDPMGSQDSWVQNIDNSMNMGASGSQMDLQGGQMGYNNASGPVTPYNDWSGYPSGGWSGDLHGTGSQGNSNGTYMNQQVDSNIRMVHSNTLKKFHCEVCGLAVKSQSVLVSHMRVHTGEKPFECTVCKKGFKRKFHLKSHMIVHYRGPENI